MTITTNAQPAPENLGLTEKESVQLGYSKNEYRQACKYSLLSMEHHVKAGTPRQAWIPPAQVGRAIAEPHIEDAAAHLTSRLEEEVDPALDDAQAAIETAKAHLDEINARTQPLSTPESGTSYSPAAAVLHVHELDERIEHDEKLSKHHHRRAPYWLKKIAPWVPYIEFVGFLWFCAVWLNVPILQPWLDFGAWTLSVAFVAAIILGQTWLIHHGGWNHNHGREAFAENNRHEGEKAYRRRTWFLAGAAVTVTAAVTAGMVLRGLMTLGTASIGTIIFMIFIAAVAGYIMPTLAYLAIATDGSKVSRERDHLGADLDGRLAEHQDLLDNSQASLAAVEETRHETRSATFPSIINSTQTIADGVYRPYGLTWLLIGHLAGDEPAKIPPRFDLDEHGRARGGRIGTSVPGADTIDLKPLFDRVERLADLDAQRAAVAANLLALTHHPWSTHRTT